jgi:hypothetical protein
MCWHGWLCLLLHEQHRCHLVVGRPSGWTSKIARTISRVQSFSHICITLCASTFGSQVESSLDRSTPGLLSSDLLAGCFHGHCCHVYGCHIMAWMRMSQLESSCVCFVPEQHKVMHAPRCRILVVFLFHLLVQHFGTAECSFCCLRYSACRCDPATTWSNAATNSSCQNC